MNLRGIKNPLMKVTNLLLYISGCFIAGTGLMLFLRMPHGRAGHGLTILGLSRHEWGDWHFYVSLAFIALSILHLFLNWAWMRKIAAASKNWRLWLGVGTGIAIIALFLIFPSEMSDTVSQGGGGGFGGGH